MLTSTVRSCVFKVLKRSFASHSKVELTAIRYPNIKRRPYAELSDKDFNAFERILGSSHILRSSSDVDSYNEDWMHSFKGQSKCVLKPTSTEEVSAVVRYCVEHSLAICTQGGNTGLVGGSVPVFDEVILSTQGLNKIQEFDQGSGILRCQAGCVLEALDNHVGQFGFMMPLDLGAKGSCHIGGNVATAAGGVRLIRYGSLHAHVLGIQVVLADEKGTVLECGKPLRKDNTGLHLPHLFVGSEGQLGIITEVTFTCVPRPSSVNSAMLSVASFDDCRKILHLARSQLGEILSSFEWMDSGTMECLEQNLKLKNVLQTPAPFYLLVESAGSRTEHDNDKLQKFLESCMDKKLILDGVVAADLEQSRKMWELRERCAEALLGDGYNYKQDISLPLKYFYEVLEEMRRRVGNSASRVIGYGHLADGNLHLNITSKQYSKELNNLIYPYLFEWVSKHGGSISAEHGLGLLKRDYAHYSNSPAALEQMRRVKRIFDPKLILNPYKTIPGLD